MREFEVSSVKAWEIVVVLSFVVVLPSLLIRRRTHLWGIQSRDMMTNPTHPNCFVCHNVAAALFVLPSQDHLFA